VLTYSSFLVRGDTGQIRIWKSSAKGQALSSKNTKLLIRQCKTSIDDTFVDRAVHFACSMGFPSMVDWMAWRIRRHVTGNTRIRGWSALDEKSILFSSVFTTRVTDQKQVSARPSNSEVNKMRRKVKGKMKYVSKKGYLKRMIKDIII